MDYDKHLTCKRHSLFPSVSCHISTCIFSKYNNNLYWLKINHYKLYYIMSMIKWNLCVTVSINYTTYRQQDMLSIIQAIRQQADITQHLNKFLVFQCKYWLWMISKPCHYSYIFSLRWYSSIYFQAFASPQGKVLMIIFYGQV